MDKIFVHAPKVSFKRPILLIEICMRNLQYEVAKKCIIKSKLMNFYETEVKSTKELKCHFST